MTTYRIALNKEGTKWHSVTRSPEPMPETRAKLYDDKEWACHVAKMISRGSYPDAHVVPMDPEPVKVDICSIREQELTEICKALKAENAKLKTEHQKLTHQLTVYQDEANYAWAELPKIAEDYLPDAIKAALNASEAAHQNTLELLSLRIAELDRVRRKNEDIQAQTNELKEALNLAWAEMPKRLTGTLAAEINGLRRQWNEAYRAVHVEFRDDGEPLQVAVKQLADGYDMVFKERDELAEASENLRSELVRVIAERDELMAQRNSMQESFDLAWASMDSNTEGNLACQIRKLVDERNDLKAQLAAKVETSSDATLPPWAEWKPHHDDGFILHDLRANGADVNNRFIASAMKVCACYYWFCYLPGRLWSAQRGSCKSIEEAKDAAVAATAWPTWEAAHAPVSPVMVEPKTKSAPDINDTMLPAWAEWMTYGEHGQALHDLRVRLTDRDDRYIACIVDGGNHSVWHCYLPGKSNSVQHGRCDTMEEAKEKVVSMTTWKVWEDAHTPAVPVSVEDRQSPVSAEELAKVLKHMKLAYGGAVFNNADLTEWHDTMRSLGAEVVTLRKSSEQALHVRHELQAKLDAMDKTGSGQHWFQTQKELAAMTERYNLALSERTDQLEAVTKERDEQRRINRHNQEILIKERNVSLGIQDKKHRRIMVALSKIDDALVTMHTQAKIDMEMDE